MKMRKLFCIIIAIGILCMVFPAFSMVSSAEQQNFSEIKEMMDVAWEANRFVKMLFGEYYEYLTHPQNHPLVIEWMKENGYYPETVETKELSSLFQINVYSGERKKIEGEGLAVAYPEQLTYEKLHADFEKYFSFDYVDYLVKNRGNVSDAAFLPCFIEDENGRLYAPLGESSELWLSIVCNKNDYAENAVLISQDASFSEIEVQKEEYSATFRFVKTDNGFRISGGSYFAPNLAPNTGDNTAIFMILAVVSIAALGVATIVISKKKTILS